MTYQVLARKWRPKDFASLVGQEHVVRALTHALDAQRLHHAYLFTGTRGVGKTTLSRILAKALNCETGITSTPCGVCNACRAIDEGRFVDYVEMDAASNRGVEEMASLLERAVYGPVDARFKVYMIDEVHMLTNHAFNAMLKTLEEPPAHVKFILATTDPQKIPVTVLSRCLQFNLKQMPPPHIVGHLEHILAAEQIAFEPQALRLLARAADGSMRDALSLTDQAIAYSAGSVGEEAVRGMLGALDQSYLIRLLDAVAVGDGTVVLAIADEMAGRSLSFSTALADLAGLLHRVAWGQFAPASVLDEWPEAADIRRFAQALSAEQVQLLYQIATIGRAELGLAPDEYAGFSMTLLRMLAFRPVNDRIADRLGAPPAPSTPSSMPPGGAVPRSTASTARIASAMPTQAQASSESKPAVERSTMVEPASDEWGDPISETPASVMPQPIERSVPVEPIREEGIEPTAKAVPESMAQVLTQPVERSVPLERPAEAVNEAAKESSAPVTTQPAGEPTVQPRSEPADAPQASAVTTAFDLPEKPMSPARAALEAMRMSGLRVTTDKSRMNAALTPAPRRPSSTPSAPLVVPTPRRPSPPAAAPATAKASDAEFTRSPNVSSAASNVGSNSGSPVDTPPWDAIPDSAYEGGYDGDHGMPSSGDFDDTASYSAPSRAAAPGRAAGAPAGAAAPASSHVTEVVPKEPPVLLSAFGEDVDWPTFVTRLSLRGFARELAFRSELLSVVGATLELRVAVPQLGDRSHVDKLKAELDTHLGRPVELSIVGGAVHYTAAAIEDARRARQQLDAERSIERDPFVQSLIRDFGASIVPGSIRPVQTAPIAPSA